LKTLNNTQLIAGIFAGVVAAILSLGATVPSTLSFFLYAATALPIFISGLGWGNRSAIISIVTAIVLAAIAVSPKFALTISLFTLLPAGWLAHLANLARPASEIGGPDDMLAWYPLSSILLHLCAIVSLAVIVLGMMMGYGPELVSGVVDAMLKAGSGPSGTTLPEGVSADQLKAALLTMLPMMQGGFWVVLLFAAYYFATRIAQATGKSLRPREDMRAALRMHRNSIFVFMIAITPTFFGGVIAIIGAVVCGTFGAGFLLSGYASLHHRLKGKDARLPVLILAYLAGLFVIPLLIIVFLGMSDVRGTISLTSIAKKDDNNPTHH
jgi:hypothetical protein